MKNPYIRRILTRHTPMLGALLFMFLISIPTLATTWTDQTASGNRNWTDVACNSDCTKIIAADSTDTSAKLYRSTDSGVTWTAVTNGGSAFQKQWKRVASNSDGTKLLASELSGEVYYSTDSGANWTSASLGTASWTGLCISDDGATMEAIANGTQVGYWYSTNSGTSWTNTAGLDALTPNTIACSSDGSKVVVGMFGNNMYYSSNSGSSWSALTNSQSGFWNGVAMSADGTKIAGVLSFAGDLWTSTDSGASWTDRSGAGTGGGGLWQSVAMSTNGATIVGVSSANVKSSTDSGASWATESAPGSGNWKDAWVSDDGSYWVIGGGLTDIWTQGSPPASPPSLTASAPSSVTTTTATFNGNITSTGNVNPTTRGFHYGTTTGYGTTSSTSGSYSTGAYTASITGLTCNTTYHYEAFATNTAGTGVSSDVSFTTSACPVAPTVTTTASPTSITASSAVAAGNITATGGESPSSRYIEYGLTTSYGSQSPSDTGTFSTGAFTERVIGLSAGTTYHYRACATNNAGTGCGSDQTFTTLSTPSQVTGLTGTAGYTQVSLSWSAPSAGDYAISDYLIEYKTTAGGTWYVWPHTASTSTSAIVTGLTNGTSYDFRVSAVSFAGAGTASSTLARTPSSTPTTPNAPTGLTGTTDSTQVALSWTAPANNGGAAITDYQIEYKTVSAGSWSTFSHSASTATSRTVTGLTNGTMYQFRVSAVNSVGTGTASSTLNKPAATTIYYHVLSTGQSLAEGVNSTPALSTTQPYNNKSLSNGPIAGSSAPLIPLVEGFVARESPISGMLNSLRAADTTNAYTIIGGSHAGGGQAYASIKKGGTGGYYALGQTQASTAKAQTEAAGAFYQPYAVTIVHGESDQIAGTTAGTYTAAMNEMHDDYESDWNTLTGLSQSIPFFESQMNTNSVGTIAVSQLDAHRNYPGEVIMVGPKYQLGYSSDDHLHLTNTGSKVLGELYGKVMKKVLIDGATWNPLMPKSVTRSGTTVTVSYKIPTGTLAIDTTNVAARTNKGFEFVQTGGSAISITGVALADSNTRVAITLSGVPDGTNPRIRYAWTCENHPNDNAYATCGDATDSGAVGGNIRDTDTTTSPASNGSGVALYDWSVAFDEAITDPAAPDAPTALTATVGNTQVGLSWTAPVVDGGSSVTDYRVEYKTAAASTWSVFADGTSTSTSATVTGLTNGTNYAFRVYATNAIGTGTSSEVVYSQPATVPGAPTSLNATGGASQVTLTWTAPASDGGALLTDYVVEYKLSADSSWTTFSDGSTSATGATVTGLTSGATYNFRVYASNVIGNSSASSTANATTDSTSAPGAPTGLGATRGNTQVALSWSAPASNGGSAITDYIVEYNDGGGWSTFADGTSTSTSATVTGLTNGTSYDFRVSAVNAIGTGSASSTATATPATTPGAPTGLGATRGNTQVALSWSAPASNGGSAITDYVVEYNSGSGWNTFNDGTSTSTSATVTSLTNGTSYDFRVSATNAVGTGSVSSTASATPATTPGAPTGLGATRGNTQVALSWSAPASNGGLSITDYVVEYNSGSGWSTFADGTSTSTSATVTGLTNGTSYDFRVSATNAVGTGSTSSTASATPATTPGTPTSLAGVAASGQTALTWTAPVSTGGAAITDYVVEYKLSSDSSWSVFADGTSGTTGATVTGLTNGFEYDFRVSATNAVGTGSVSSTASAIYVIAPGVPTSLSATAGDTQVSLSWSAPALNGGASITDYVVEYKLSSDSSWTIFTDGTSTSASATVTGLTNDLSYDFRVSATNIAGTGSAGSTASATPVAPRVGGGHTIAPIMTTGVSTTTRDLNTVNSTGTIHTYVSPIDAKVRACPAAAHNVKLGAKNDRTQVQLWQAFLNKELGLKIPLTGFYGPMTFAATKDFQLVHKDEILTPLGLINPTGHIATATRAVANKILGCDVQ